MSRTKHRRRKQPVVEQPESGLPEALTGFRDAVANLVEERPQTVDGGDIRWMDSLYKQLHDAVPGQFLGRTKTQRSQPPMWVDAADLLTDIRKTVKGWHPNPCVHVPLFLGGRNIQVRVDGHDLTLRRLGLLASYTWRPQDVPMLKRYTNQVEGWCKRIETLFTETHTKHLPSPCPACDTKTVYRTDAAGERVRQPALQIAINPDGSYLGCKCQNCGHVWTPEYFLHLARVLDYALPEGVLE